MLFRSVQRPANLIDYTASIDKVMIKGTNTELRVSNGNRVTPTENNQTLLVTITLTK